MPTNRMPLRRIRGGRLSHEQEMSLWFGDVDRYAFGSDDERREQWFRHRDRLMALWARNGNRPDAWWDYESPIERPTRPRLRGRGAVGSRAAGRGRSCHAGRALGRITLSVPTSPSSSSAAGRMSSSRARQRGVRTSSGPASRTRCFASGPRGAVGRRGRFARWQPPRRRRRRPRRKGKSPAVVEASQWIIAAPSADGRATASCRSCSPKTPQAARKPMPPIATARASRADGRAGAEPTLSRRKIVRPANRAHQRT